MHNAPDILVPGDAAGRLRSIADYWCWPGDDGSCQQTEGEERERGWGGTGTLSRGGVGGTGTLSAQKGPARADISIH